MLGVSARRIEMAQHAQDFSPQNRDNSSCSGCKPAGRRRLDLPRSVSPQHGDDSTWSGIQPAGLRRLDIIGVSARSMEMTQQARGFSPQGTTDSDKASEKKK
jgi:hypothetical protein